MGELLGGFTPDLGRHSHRDLYWPLYLEPKIGMESFQAKYSSVSKYALCNQYSDRWNNLILLF